ncbi:hypothetical protein E2C01_064976 [Portunus trituberculatus]|uniref:Uncharacterized protein n=1 Tax=Portunus trituberculatus TaxID=210409 RepID=A0A5B7HHM2_PORTR|nr:hypothetical protein [Portunus trituberculatus]
MKVVMSIKRNSVLAKQPVCTMRGTTIPYHEENTDGVYSDISDASRFVGKELSGRYPARILNGAFPEDVTVKVAQMVFVVVVVTAEIVLLPTTPVSLQCSTRRTFRPARRQSRVCPVHTFSRTSCVCARLEAHTRE